VYLKKLLKYLVSLIEEANIESELKVDFEKDKFINENKEILKPMNN
jgi:hypothetical protein